MKPIVIALAGKGGTGKTTTSGMIIDYLVRNDLGPILAVDADPNSNLNEVLGMDIDITLGELRESIARAELDNTIPSGMTKQEYAEFMFADALAEGDDFDLMVMGRTQGQGCYCYVNGVLKAQVDKYAKNYRYIVVDNEAGLEHISRGTLPHIDILLLVSDCSRRGVQAAGRLARMVEDMKLNPAVMKLIVNRAPNGVLDSGIMEEVENQKLELLGVLPQDETVYKCDCEGKPTALVAPETPIKAKLSEMLKEIIK